MLVSFIRDFQNKCYFFGLSFYISRYFRAHTAGRPSTHTPTPSHGPPDSQIPHPWIQPTMDDPVDAEP